MRALSGTLFEQPSFSGLVVIVNGLFPAGVQRRTASDGADSLSQRLIVELGSSAVGVIVHGAVFADAEILCRLHGIDVGSQEQEFPTVLFLLALNHLFDLLAVVMMACVLHAVCRDDEQGMLRHIFGPRVLMDVADMMDGAADGVQQGGAASHGVVLVSHGPDAADVGAVVDHFAGVVEQDSGDERFARLFLLFCNHGVETSDGVRLKPAHGAAAVENEYEFCQILFQA